MKNNYRPMMENLTLSPAARASIEAAISNTSRKKPRKAAESFLRFSAAACIVIAMLLFLHPTTAQAVEEFADKIKSIFAWKPDTVTPDDSSTGPVWLKEKDGRVYFVANLANLDITDQISPDYPFTYIYEKAGIIHYIAVGGTYTPETGLDGVGYGEWLRRKDAMEEGINEGDLYAGWIGGDSHFKYLDEEGTIYEIWYARAIVEMDIPWGNTDARRQLKGISAAE